MKIDGIKDIETDTSARVCSFKVAASNKDYKSKLADMAKTNTHLADYVIQ